MDEAFDLAKLRRGNPDEFARVVRAHQRIVLALCQAQGMSYADASDAAAEVFCMVYRALPSFRGESLLATWIYRIAHRTIVRLRVRRPRFDDLPADVRDPTLPTPASACETVEINALLWAAVARLDPDQAGVVELYYRQSWNIETIAAVLEKPEGTIKTLLHRARLRLRQILASLENADAR